MRSRGCLFTETDIKAQDLAVPRHCDAGGDHKSHANHAIAVAYFEIFGIEPNIWVRALQRTLLKPCDAFVESLA